MNAGQCTLLVDGTGLFVLDGKEGTRRRSTFEDWLEATRLIDAMDELGVYWMMVDPGLDAEDPSQMVKYWRHLFGGFSKHVQNGISDPALAPWYLEVLEVIFGGKEAIREQHPVSMLLCPQSPLIIEGPYTDAYLALAGYDIPAAVMPMPLMGSTAPGSLTGTLILANCEVLGMLCLIQAAAPGTPFLYAPSLAVMDPRTARLASGAVEGAIMAAGGIQMARHYGLPVLASSGGTDQFVPGVQAGYERAVNWALPMLAWPDILVGPGLLGGAMILSLEQLVIDVEVYRMCRRAHEGIASDTSSWLDEVISRVGPGGHFMLEDSTVRGVREGEWYISDLGWHSSYEEWQDAGRPDLLQEASEKVDQLLATHEPIPLGEDVRRELNSIAWKAEQSADH